VFRFYCGRRPTRIFCFLTVVGPIEFSHKNNGLRRCNWKRLRGQDFFSFLGREASATGQEKNVFRFLRADLTGPTPDLLAGDFCARRTVEDPFPYAPQRPSEGRESRPGPLISPLNNKSRGLAQERVWCDLTQNNGETCVRVACVSDGFTVKPYSPREFNTFWRSIIGVFVTTVISTVSAFIDEIQLKPNRFPNVHVRPGYGFRAVNDRDGPVVSSASRGSFLVLNALNIRGERVSRDLWHTVNTATRLHLL